MIVRLKKIAAIFCLLSCFILPAFAADTPQDADKRADAIIAKMTLEQKIDLLGGIEGFYTRGYPELGIPKLRMADGPTGVRNFGLSTAYPAGVALAATFDKDMALRIGTAIGRDARAKGVHFHLAPGVNIYRSAMNGRNFEYFGEDPYLSARIVVGYINGVQSQQVISTVKHFAANNSEFDRHGTNSIVDERTLREIYLPAFEAAVKEAHTGAVMDSYNFINGQHATQNDFLNNKVLKQEWGFKGILMSDWTATYDAVAAANGGLDLEMPAGDFLNQKNLLPAVKEGKVTEATINDKVHRILRTAILFGFLDRPQEDLSIPRYSSENKQIALEGEQESIVLLKNQGNILPLNKQSIKTIAVFGPDAYPANAAGGGSAHVEPFSSVSYLQGISDYLGQNVRVLYNPGVLSVADIAENTPLWTDAEGKNFGVSSDRFSSEDFNGTPQKGFAYNLRYEAGGGPPSSTRFTAYYRPEKTGKYRFFAQSTGTDSYKLFVNDKVVFEQEKKEGQVPKSIDLDLQAGSSAAVRLEYVSRPSWLGSRMYFGVQPVDDIVSDEAKKIAAKADAVVLFVGFDKMSESEGADRTFQLPPNQDELIKTIAAINKNTIVHLTGGGGVDMTQWVDQVPAIVHGWYGGQEAGRAFANVLFGDVNPSGHLPVTIERRWEDNPAHDSYYPNDPQDGANAVKYNEGVFVGYRGYEKNNVKPLFPFGHGLSYTTFAYKNLKISPEAPKAGEKVTVSFDVTNTGKRAGADVAQLYVGNPGASVPRPAKELKAFGRVNLKSGETQHVTFTLDERAMSYWDVKTSGWRQDAGAFTINVGDSSADTPLSGKFNVTK